MFRRSNRLIGRIPPSLGTGLQSLQHLRLGHNRISGTIPASLATIAPLRTLFVQHNELTGQVPDDFIEKIALGGDRDVPDVDDVEHSIQDNVAALRLRIRPGTQLSTSPALTGAILASDTALSKVRVCMINSALWPRFNLRRKPTFSQAEKQLRSDDLRFPKPKPVRVGCIHSESDYRDIIWITATAWPNIILS